jgi:hypothetical protein
MIREHFILLLAPHRRSSLGRDLVSHYGCSRSVGRTHRTACGGSEFNRADIAGQTFLIKKLPLERFRRLQFAAVFEDLEANAGKTANAGTHVGMMHGTAGGSNTPSPGTIHFRRDH